MNDRTSKTKVIQSYLRDASMCLKLAACGDGLQFAAANYKIEEAQRLLSEMTADETTPVPGRRYRWSAEGMLLDDTGPWASGEMVRRAEEPTPKPSRDAEHCDYPDCEQHWTHVVAKARALLEPLADCDPAIRQWLKTADLPSLQSGPPLYRHDWETLPGQSYRCRRCKTTCLDAHDALLCAVRPEKASEAWVCPKCQQLNSASATTCGRCDDL